MKLDELQLIEEIVEPKTPQMPRMPKVGGNNRTKLPVHKVGNLEDTKANQKPGMLEVRNTSLKIFRQVFKRDIVDSKELGIRQSMKMTNVILGNLNDAIRNSRPGEERKKAIQDTIIQMKKYVDEEKEKTTFGKDKSTGISKEAAQEITDAYKTEEDTELLKKHLQILKSIQIERKTRGNTKLKFGRGKTAL